MKAYSLDLRQKIVEAYEKGNRSQRQLARDFGVALSFIQKLLKRYRETGSYAPKKRRYQTPCKLDPEKLEVLKAIVQQKNDATLAELRQELAKRTGVTVGISTLFRMFKKLNFTYKKNQQ